MYNIYSEEKKLLESDKKQREKEENIIYDEKHREKTNHLALNYQKRIKKFMIDVRKYFNFIILDGRRKSSYRSKNR